MNRSEDRILTTHTGSFQRPPELRAMLMAREAGSDYDRATFDATVRAAVGELVRRQVDTGLSSVNDGEQSKISFVNYIRLRLNGFGGTDDNRPIFVDEREFPGWVAMTRRNPNRSRPACDGPISWRDFGAVETDIANLGDAAAAAGAPEVFMTAVSPGTLVNFFPNQYYPSRTAYLEAIVEAMRREYRAIIDAGFILQVDSPDLAVRDLWFPDHSIAQFREVVRDYVGAINAAVEGLPMDRVRVHVCWGVSERPARGNVPMQDIIDLLLTAVPQGLSFVASNGRHEHEWKLWRDVKLPADKVVIPGVIDSTTNIIEHPEVVAERIVRFAGVVPKRQLMGGVDCGFSWEGVDPDVAFAKLASLVEGASLASKELW